MIAIASLGEDRESPTGMVGILTLVVLSLRK
jgi:hypothetical protein